MRLELMVTLELEAEDRAYVRSVERPYARVPIAGEVVALNEGEHVHGEVIESVAWENDGTPTLEFRCNALEGSWVDEVWLLANGYTYIDVGEEDE